MPAGQPCPGHKIELKATDGGRKSTESRPDGAFLIDDLAPGRYEIAVEHPLTILR